MPDRLPTVFIGSSSEGQEVAEHVQAALQEVCEATLWSQGVFGLGSNTLHTLVRAVEDYDFAILVLTPDDLVTKRGEERPAARDNVVFEAGLFIGGLGPDRTFLIHCRDDRIDLPSDLAGITTARYKRRQDGNLQAAIAPAVLQIKEAIKKLSGKPPAQRDPGKRAVAELAPSDAGSRQALSFSEARDELNRELDVLSRSLMAQGWKVKTRSQSAFRVVSPTGKRHTLPIGDPRKTREDLRPFACKLAQLGIRISQTLLS